MKQNSYNGINNNYQYLRDKQADLLEEQKSQQAQGESQIASNYGEADLYANGMAGLADTFSDNGTDRLVKTGLKGFASGYGQGIANRKNQDRNKLQEVMKSFEGQNRAIKQQLEEVRTREYAKEKMKPYMTAYLKNMYNLNPDSRKLQVNQLIAMSNQLLGDDDELVSIDDRNPALWTVRNRRTNEVIVIDAGVMFAGQDVTERELAEMQTSAIQKRQVEQEERDKKNQIEQNKLNQDIRKNSPNAKFNNKAAELEAERLKDVVVKANETIYNASKVNEILGEIKQIADDNPEIFNSILLPVWSDTEHTTMKIIAKKLSMFDKDNEKTSTALSDIEKRTNELVAMGAKGFGGRANVFIEKIFQSSTPNAGMAKGAFYSVTNDMIEKNNKDIENGYSALKDYNSKLSHTGVDQFQEGFGGQRRQSDNYQILKNKKSGEVAKVPASEAKTLINKGNYIWM